MSPSIKHQQAYAFNTCDKCKKQFSLPHILRVHNINVHEVEKPSQLCCHAFEIVDSNLRGLTIILGKCVFEFKISNSSFQGFYFVF